MENSEELPIYQGDALELIPEIISPDEADLIIADPPYNASKTNIKLEGNKTGGDFYSMDEGWDKLDDNEYFSFTRKWLNESKTVLKSSGSIYVCATFHNLGEILVTLKSLDLEVKNVIVWKKTNAMPNVTKRTFTHSTEFIVWAVKGSNWTFNYEKMKEINPNLQKNGQPKQMRDVWEFPLCQGKERIKGKNNRALHPNQKPESLFKRLVLASSNPKDLVLDPFIGIGTTAVIAERYNRDWLGIEKNEKYIKAAKKRIIRNRDETLV